MKAFTVIREVRMLEAARVELPEDATKEDIIDAAYDKGFKVVKRYVEDTWVE